MGVKMYSVVNRLSGPLRIGLAGGDSMVLSPGEPVLVNERDIGAFKAHPMVEVKVDKVADKSESKKRSNNVRGK